MSVRYAPTALPRDLRKAGSVSGTSVPFSKERAPCGKTVGGSRHHESDDDGLAYNVVTYSCGCQHTQHQFHDGTFRTRVIRHDGRVLLNECSAEHGE
jgi:hypothetical protein